MENVKFFLLCTILSALAVFGMGMASAAVVNVSDADTPAQIQAAIVGASANDVINFSAGNYSDVRLMIDKSLTLLANTGDYRTSGVVLTNDSKFYITANVHNVTIKGFVFENITTNLTGREKYNSGNATILFNGGNRNATVEKNKFHNTSRSGIGAWSGYRNPVFNFSLVDNNFSLIGNNLPPNYSIGKRSQMSAVKMAGVNDSFFKNNSINGTTWSGMNLVFIYNSEVSGNEVYRAAKNGIQIANSSNSHTTIKNNVIMYSNTDRTRVRNERSRMGKREKAGGGGERIEVLHNDTTNFNNSVVRLVETNMKAGISIDGSSRILIENNTIAHNHDGIIVCPSDCSVVDPYVSLNEHGGYYIGTSANITRNRIYNNSGSFRSLYHNSNSNYPNDVGTGRNFVSGFSSAIDVSHNYWGVENPESLFTGSSGSFERKYYSNVNFRPYYTDTALTNLVRTADEDDDDDDGSSSSRDDDDDDDSGRSSRSPPVTTKKPVENKTKNKTDDDDETIILTPKKNDTDKKKTAPPVIPPVVPSPVGGFSLPWFLWVLFGLVFLIVLIMIIGAIAKSSKRKKAKN